MAQEPDRCRVELTGENASDISTRDEGTWAMDWPVQWEDVCVGDTRGGHLEDQAGHDGDRRGEGVFEGGGGVKEGGPCRGRRDGCVHYRILIRAYFV